MESINNMANAAVKAVWPENENSAEQQDKNKQEPVSGELGDTTKGEPYDAGNKEENTNTDNTNTGNTNIDNTDNTNTDNTNADNTNTEEGHANPTETKDSSATKGDSTKDQNDVRDPSNPTTHPDTAAEKKNVDNSGKPKLDGPGPRPLDDLAKEHGGDAGKIGAEGDAKKDGGEGADNDDGDDGEEDGDGPQKKSHGEGTGEQWVKSSGLKADGGDFDAANPGAGKEADRLLEQKGIHREDPNKSAGINDVTGDDGIDSGEKEKKSLGAKIKEKFHHSGVGSV